MPLPSVKRSDQIYQNSWRKGIITSLPAEELPPDAAQDLLNVEFDTDSNLITRNGTSLFVDTTEQGRLTSLFRAEYSNGTVYILFTIGNKLYRCDETGGSLTDITSTLTLPDNTFWQWTMFDDFAIGVNKATSGDNPIKVNSSGVASKLNASAPFAKYCEVWNNRLWLTGTGSNQNTIYGSAINDPEDWTVDDDSGAVTLGIDVNDGDYITGIKVFRGSMYVYKRRKINVVSPISAPATIPSNLRVDVYTTNLGCISAYTIQNVLDDQVFLSSSGIASLSLAPLGELKGSILSDNIAQLSLIKRNTDEIPSFVLDDMNQYWISIPSGSSATGEDEVWVLDYQKINEKDEGGFPLVRWVRMNGLVAGTAYTERLDGNYKTYLIGAYEVASTDTPIYQYTPKNPTKTFNDASNAYVKRVLTKAFAPQSSLIRSIWYRFGAAFKLISTTVTMNINYYYNNGSSLAGSYPLTFSLPNSLNIWGTALWDQFVWDDLSATVSEELIWRQFRKNNFGRKARTVTLEFMSQSVDEGFILKFIQLEVTALNVRRARTR